MSALIIPELDNRTPLAVRGRILALDVGKKRIGLAVSDALHITAQGLETLQRTRVREDLERLRRLTEERQIRLLLVGRPLHMSGDESRQSEYTAEFAAKLAKYVNLPVVYWDERLTSKEAERALRAGGATLAQRKKAVDRMSATLLLESYLENQHQGSWSGQTGWSEGEEPGCSEGEETGWSEEKEEPSC